MGNIFTKLNSGAIKFKSLISNPTGAEGMIIYNSTDKKLRFYDGTNWVDA